MATKQIGNNGSSAAESLFDSNSGNKYIFGIGIDAYTDFQRLNNAVRDVEDVVKVLKTRYQFENATVNLLINAMATREHILTQLENYEDLGPEDILIIYYSGHGHLKQGKHGYWIPYDAKKNVAASYISTSDVLTRIRSLNAKHILLISDSCFSGAFLSEDAIKRGAAGDMALSDLAGLRSRWGICSGRQDEYVYDGEPGKNSPFAESIIRLLTDNRQHKFNISWLVNEVMKLTRDKSKHLPEGKPLLDTGDKGGQLILQLREDIKQWHALEEKPNRSSKDYADFLEKYKTSIYTLNALEAKRAHYDTETWQNAERMNTMSGYENYIQSDHTPKAYEQEARNQKRNLATADQQAWEKSIRNIKTSLQEYTKRSDEGKHLDLAKKWIAALEDGSVPLPAQKSQNKEEEAVLAPPPDPKPTPGKIARANAEHSIWRKIPAWAIVGIALLLGGLLYYLMNRTSGTERPNPVTQIIVTDTTQPPNPPSTAKDTARPEMPKPAKEEAIPSKTEPPKKVEYELIASPPKPSSEYTCTVSTTEKELIVTIKNLKFKKLQVFSFNASGTFFLEKGKEKQLPFPRFSTDPKSNIIRIVLSDIKSNGKEEQLDTIILTKKKKGE